jgi:micrococcal nuclease
MLLFFLACGGAVPNQDQPQDTHSPVDTGERDPLRDLNPDSLPQTSSPCREAEVVWVKSVVDGDTIKVEGKWGGETVRLIGIDTPEMDWDGNHHECWAEEALAALHELVFEKWVWLSFDQECEDDYERTLAYVHRGTGIEDFTQRALLRNGHAEAFKVNPNSHFHSLFSADESYASGEEIGLWKDCR